MRSDIQEDASRNNWQYLFEHRINWKQIALELFFKKAQGPGVYSDLASFYIYGIYMSMVFNTIPSSLTLKLNQGIM